MAGITGFDPFESIQPRNVITEQEEQTVVETDIVQKPVPVEQPQQETSQKRPRIRREGASRAKKVSEDTPEPETDSTQLVRCGFRCPPELREQLDDAAWFATGGDLSKLIRGACRREIQRLIELNSGKELPKRPKGMKPIADEVYE